MALSKETVKKLRAVKNAITAEPTFYDQYEPPGGVTSCKTPCCIAGWAIWLDNPKTYLTRAKYRRSDYIAAEVLGITRNMFRNLWVFPVDWDIRYIHAKGAAGRAAVAAARIEHFIATDGAE